MLQCPDVKKTSYFTHLPLFGSPINFFDSVPKAECRVLDKTKSRDQSLHATDAVDIFFLSLSVLSFLFSLALFSFNVSSLSFSFSLFFLSYPLSV